MKIDGYTPSLPQQMTAMHAVAAPVGSKSVELFTLTHSVIVRFQTKSTQTETHMVRQTQKDTWTGQI